MRWVFLLFALVAAVLAAPLPVAQPEAIELPDGLQMMKRTFKGLRYPLGAEINELNAIVAKINHFDESARMYTNHVSTQLHDLARNINRTTPPTTIQGIISNYLKQAIVSLKEAYAKEDKGDYYGLIGRVSGLVGHAQGYT